MNSIRTLLSLSLLLLSLPLQAATVLASIKPVSLIATELLAGVAKVETLLPEGVSPHDFALRPSDRRRIAQADLVIWVGPETEPYLQKVIAAEGVVELHWQESAEEHAGHSEQGVHGEHDHAELHPWLSPESAEHFSERLALALQARFPQGAEQISANAKAFVRSLGRLEQRAQSRLAAVKNEGFFVFHDAYQGLVEHYGLNQVGYFTLDPSRKPGAKHLARLREVLEQSRAVCVFVEPQYSPKLIESITRGVDVRQGQLDPLASDILPGVGSYEAFMLGLVEQLAQCLTPQQAS